MLRRFLNLFTYFCSPSLHLEFNRKVETSQAFARSPVAHDSGRSGGTSIPAPSRKLKPVRLMSW